MLILPRVYKEEILEIFKKYDVPKVGIFKRILNQIALNISCRKDCKTLLKANEKYYDSNIINLYKTFESEPDDVRCLDNLAGRIVNNEIERNCQKQAILYFCGRISEKTFSKRCSKIEDRRFF